jgi:hypothetical protein
MQCAFAPHVHQSIPETDGLEEQNDEDEEDDEDQELEDLANGYA